MATLKTTDVKTIKQSWHDVVSQLDREETPFYSSIGSNSEAGSVLREFFYKKLNDATDNFIAEGADAPAATSTNTDRAANALQIFTKVRSVSGTLEATSNVGVSSKFAEQLEDAGKELKRDIERALVGAQGSAISGVRKLAGAEAWIKTNALHGVDGATAGFNEGTNLVGAVTAGTARALTETMLNDAFQKIWEQGGRAKSIYTNGKQRRVLSSFDGGKTVNVPAEKKTVMNTVDYYQGDFGKYAIVPDFLMSQSTILLIDEATWNVSYLRKITKKDLPEAADRQSKMLIAELTLESRNERGNGKIADLS
jgi:hypothetical protein